MVTKSKEDVDAAYRSEPWWYDVRGFLILTFAYNSSLGSQMRLFAPNIGAQHLELACGTGTLLEMFVNWRRRKGLPPSDRIVGVDYAQRMLAGARHRFREQQGFDWMQADAADLPMNDASFDTLNIANAIHCLPDPAASIQEAFRVLKPGGRLAANVLLVPQTSWPFDRIAKAINDWGIRRGILVRPFELTEVRPLFERAGFEITHQSVSGNCCNLLARRPPP